MVSLRESYNNSIKIIRLSTDSCSRARVVISSTCSLHGRKDNCLLTKNETNSSYLVWGCVLLNPLYIQFYIILPTLRNYCCMFHIWFREHGLIFFKQHLNHNRYSLYPLHTAICLLHLFFISTRQIRHERDLIFEK